MAHLKAQETKRHATQRKEWKLSLVRLEALAIALLNFSSLAELEIWLESH